MHVACAARFLLHFSCVSIVVRGPGSEAASLDASCWRHTPEQLATVVHCASTWPPWGPSAYFDKAFLPGAPSVFVQLPV